MEILCVCVGGGGGGGGVAGKPHLHIQSAKVYQFQFCPKVLGGGGGGGGLLGAHLDAPQDEPCTFSPLGVKLHQNFKTDWISRLILVRQAPTFKYSNKTF